ASTSGRIGSYERIPSPRKRRTTRCRPTGPATSSPGPPERARSTRTVSVIGSWVPSSRLRQWTGEGVGPYGDRSLTREGPPNHPRAGERLAPDNRLFV